ncbi:MAG: hypothetical protein D3917_17930 [Candidatus Electrothrix sp. AX5]|nr:hypothetical protein [Candidatus Electrothrix sp. AX5]
MITQEALRKKADNIIQSVANSPDGRFQLRKIFYRKFGHRTIVPYGYGKSELDFMEWEIKRGVLNPLNDPDQPGSPWWRRVNEQLMYYSELAGLAIAQEKQFTDWEQPVQTWLHYMQNPGGKNWYRAHNTSISTSYLTCKKEALQEPLEEQVFFNIVLFRLYFAQAMVEGATFFKDLGEFFADPQLPAVDFITSLVDFYPDTYPLSTRQLHVVLGHSWTDIEHWSIGILDNYIILPELKQLYKAVANTWNNIPDVMTMIHKRKPAYPDISVSQYF